jgi:nucleotide-binding universal stress UspA family protein
VSTILIGVDDSTRSEDAIAFARRLAGASKARVVVACAFPYSDVPSRASNLMYREMIKSDADATAQRMAKQLEGIARERIKLVTIADPSPAHALHDAAVAEAASIVIVGSTHTGRPGRVMPGSTAERLLHGTPCPVAVVPDGYRSSSPGAIDRIGVAYTDSEEGRAALSAAADLARALGAELEIATAVPRELYGTGELSRDPSYAMVHDDLVARAREGLREAGAALPEGIVAKPVLLDGDAADQLVEHSARLDLLIIGSRGYGPLRAVLAGGVSGRVVRAAHCPVIVVPRGVPAPLAELFGAAAATSA